MTNFFVAHATAPLVFPIRQTTITKSCTCTGMRSSTASARIPFHIFLRDDVVTEYAVCIGFPADLMPIIYWCRNCSLLTNSACVLPSSNRSGQLHDSVCLPARSHSRVQLNSYSRIDMRSTRSQAQSKSCGNLNLNVETLALCSCGAHVTVLLVTLFPSKHSRPWYTRMKSRCSLSNVTVSHLRRSALFVVVHGCDCK